MTPGIVLLLFVSGLAGGVINALAGGATLLTFPAMLAAGLPPVTANASNAVAIVPGHLLAVLADRGKLLPFDAKLWLSILVCLAGGAVGALLLLALPERLFVLPVPALIGIATLLFLFSPRGLSPPARAHVPGFAACPAGALPARPRISSSA